MRRSCVARGVNRVSLGAQTFQPELLATVLERRARPGRASRASVPILRAAGIDNLSLDLIYGIPGQSVEDRRHPTYERGRRVSLPKHVSAYELEAKPGTRFTHAYGAELERQSEGLEHYMELVTETLQSQGYRWYETASFCRAAGGDRRDLRSRHNLGYWLAHDYVGIGIGAVLDCCRASLAKRSVARPLYGGPARRRASGKRARADLSPLFVSGSSRCSVCGSTRVVEEAVIDPVLDPGGLERMLARGLVEHGAGEIRLSARGRLLGGAVTVELLVDPAELDQMRSDARVPLGATL